MKPDPVDVIVVTVIQPELRAAVAALGLREADREHDEAGTTYYQGAVRSALSGQEIRIAVTCVGNAGNLDAAAAVRDAIAWGHPRAVLLTGIAAGMRGIVQLGDVVLADRVVSYEPAALVAGSAGSRVEVRPEIEKVPHAMSQHIVSYRPEPERLARLLGRIGGCFPECSSTGMASEQASAVKIHRGTIASGEKLVRDAARMQEIRDLYAKIIAVDMESAGIVAACRRGAIPWLVIRGISDFGDAHKDDHFHDRAAGTAAAVLADFLSYGLDLAPSAPARQRRDHSPRYPDERTRRLGEQLQDALRRRRALVAAGAKAAKVDQEIVQIKRQLREGGQLRAGDSLGDGRYLLLEQVGRGGFASVWKALDHTQGSIVAVKVLHPDLGGDMVRRERFLRGARIMAQLDHPAVARVLEPGAEDGGFYYFVLELAHGGDLRRAVLEGRFPKDRALPLLIRLGEALAHAHEKGVVHRDVKPANILLDESGQPKLTDFDLVNVGDTTGGTRTGALGTVLYAAPECLHHPQEADARADIYGLGMTAVFCLHGAELPVDVIRGSDEVIDALDCDERIRHLLRQATAWKKEQRLANAEAFCEGLRAALRSTVSGAESVVKYGTDILAWITDGRNDETVWLTQDGDRARVVARAPALILAAADQVWLGQRRKRSIRLLDRNAQAFVMDRRMENDDSLIDVPIVQAEIDDVLLVNAASGNTISLSSSTVDDSVGERPEAFWLEQSIEIVASAGPYLFVRTDLNADWGGAHPSHETTFRVLDLRSGKDAELLTDEERVRLTGEEGQRAMLRLRERMDYFLDGDEKPELTLFLLSYQHGGPLSVEYQFTAPTAYVASDGRWSAYTCSELVRSEKLPSSLQAYKKAPRLLERYWAKAPRLTDCVRWTEADCSPCLRGLLRRSFHEGTS
ncbi:protein kinase domain-containing protein [Sorangium sp. So ce1097]|uniref:protein kinase domain-containing protein n=1 Tax=Sorangium sp. So ce1097 TaxID=3133330 RepID=UPI003F61423D